MRLLLVALLTLLSVPALAQEPLPVDCPEGYVCLTDEQYADVHDKLEEFAVIEEGTPTITFSEPVVITTDERYRVYSNGTGAQLIPGLLTWGTLSAELELGVDVDVRRKEPPQGGFRARPKLQLSWLVLESPHIVEDPMRLFDLGVSLDFLYFRKFNVNAYVGARSFGAGVGFDVFRNSGIEIDARWTWPFKLGEAEITPPVFTPSLGWYFAF